MTIASEILTLATARQATVTIAESCTGGMVAAALTELPGSSAIFERGFVTYSNAAKREMLNVSAQSLSSYGAVSEEVAREMAVGAQTAARATLACAITGIAGPGGSDHKPEGRVCFAIASVGNVITQTVEFGALGRASVRSAARDHALGLVLQALQKLPTD